MRAPRLGLRCTPTTAGCAHTTGAPCADRPEDAHPPLVEVIPVSDPPSGQASQRLVVLDFSGTLSIAAVRFGQPASIESAVQECGLADQAVDARVLWSEIILPSWHKTITTRRGYEGVLTDAAMTVLSARGRPTDRVADGIAAFTRRYLAAIASRRNGDRGCDALRRCASPGSSSLPITPPKRPLRSRRT